MDDEPGFWRRQFRLPPTSRQTMWDVLFGICLPLACLAGDRVLFWGGRFIGHGDDPVGWSLFGDFAVLAYAFIVTEVLLLGLWILLRRKLTRSSAFFSGPFLAAWLFSLLLATVLLPVSVVGLVLVIGILGFSPWLTFFAFFRNWRMTRLLSSDHVSKRRRFWLTVAGVVFAVTPALALHHHRDLVRSIGGMKAASSASAERAWRTP